MFNSYRVKYSPETQQLLKVLMDEARMSATQRQKVNDTLKRGEPLPPISCGLRRPSYVDENLFDLKRNYYFMKRTQDQIRRSGAYDHDKFRLLHPLVDKEKEKDRLVNIMAFGKAPRKVERSGSNGNSKKNKVTPDERIEELISEIQERLLFLDDMAQLGERKTYEHTIKQEIAAKLRELERLDRDTAQKYVTLLEPPEKLRSNMDEVLRWHT